MCMVYTDGKLQMFFNTIIQQHHQQQKPRSKYKSLMKNHKKLWSHHYHENHHHHNNHQYSYKKFNYIAHRHTHSYTLLYYTYICILYISTYIAKCNNNNNAIEWCVYNFLNIDHKTNNNFFFSIYFELNLIIHIHICIFFNACATYRQFSTIT